MKTDVINVKNSGEGMDAALEAASASATYRGLDNKSAIRLRLLAEEMLGMMCQITNGSEAEFWVESEGSNFELHLVAHPLVTGKMRSELLNLSTTGKNEAARGFMGKIRDIFDRALAAQDPDELSAYYAQNMVIPADLYLNDAMSYAGSMSMVTWSMNNYKEAIAQDNAHRARAKEAWDELEKSIVANIADEVKIAIAGDNVELTVYKQF